MTTRRAFLQGFAATLVVIDDPHAAEQIATAAEAPAAPVVLVVDADAGGTLTMATVRRAMQIMKRSSIPPFDLAPVRAGDLRAAGQYHIMLSPDRQAAEIINRTKILDAEPQTHRRVPGATPKAIRSFRSGPRHR